MPAHLPLALLTPRSESKLDCVSGIPAFGMSWGGQDRGIAEQVHSAQPFVEHPVKVKIEFSTSERTILRSVMEEPGPGSMSRRNP